MNDTAAQKRHMGTGEEAPFEIGQTWVVETPMGDHYYHVVQVDDKRQTVQVEYWPDYYPAPQLRDCEMAQVRKLAHLAT
jgi:hypothetical protein